MIPQKKSPNFEHNTTDEDGDPDTSTISLSYGGGRTIPFGETTFETGLHMREIQQFIGTSFYVPTTLNDSHATFGVVGGIGRRTRCASRGRSGRTHSVRTRTIVPVVQPNTTSETFSQNRSPRATLCRRETVASTRRRHVLHMLCESERPCDRSVFSHVRLHHVFCAHRPMSHVSQSRGPHPTNICLIRLCAYPMQHFERIINHGMRSVIVYPF